MRVKCRIATEIYSMLVETVLRSLWDTAFEWQTKNEDEIPQCGSERTIISLLKHQHTSAGYDRCMMKRDGGTKECAHIDVYVFLSVYSICNDLSSIRCVCGVCCGVSGLVLLLLFSFNLSLRRSFVTVWLKRIPTIAAYVLWVCVGDCICIFCLCLYCGRMLLLT